MAVTETGVTLKTISATSVRYDGHFMHDIPYKVSLTAPLTCLYTNCYNSYGFTVKEIGCLNFALSQICGRLCFTLKCIVLQLFVSDYLIQMHANYSIDAAEVCAKGNRQMKGLQTLWCP